MILKSEYSIYHEINRDFHKSNVVKYVFIVYWLLIFEGALRKWLFPEIHQILYFIRDPFVLIVYWYAIKSNRFPKGLLFYWIVVFAILMFFVALIQLLYGDVNIFVLLFGWRNYFLYAPLPFVIGLFFEKSDLVVLIRRSLKVSVPLAFLVYLQYLSPVDSFINKGVTEDGFVFQVVEDVVRTTGTFTFTSGQTFFCGSLFAMLAYAWILPKSIRFISNIWLWASSIAVLSMIAVSGSRTVFFLVFLVLLACLFNGIISLRPEIRVRSLFAPMAILVVGGLGFVFLFNDSYNAMQTRQANAVSEEGSTLVRAFASFYDFIDFADDTPFLGYGIGSESAGGAVLKSGVSTIIADDEWSRIVLEVGFILALLYIFTRIALTFKIFSDCVAKIKYDGDPLGLILFGFFASPLLNGPITTQGSVHCYVWIFCGFCMAASKSSYIVSHGREAN